ncbi:MAG: hypothetical protein A2046_05625 [Bacteroidetes bacterium GWA2_30_7]|nr:MAG: hypothetical protein A2046_05625 [Bacteroidetes bacterium GWA2_30_7]
MKLSLILFSIICLLGCYDKPDNRFYTEDGRFKVSLPTNPVVKNVIVNSNYGNILFSTYFSKKSETEKYYASSSVYDYSVKNNEDKKLLLENSKNYLLNQFEIDITEERDTVINQYFGNIFRASGSNFFIEILQLIDNNRVFQVGIMKNDVAPSEKDFLDLINSFEIVKPIYR